jgi:hypothetical protein
MTAAKPSRVVVLGELGELLGLIVSAEVVEGG